MTSITEPFGARLAATVDETADALRVSPEYTYRRARYLGLPIEQLFRVDRILPGGPRR